MGNRFLLETNIVIALFADEAIVKSYLAQATEEQEKTTQPKSPVAKVLIEIGITA